MSRHSALRADDHIIRALRLRNVQVAGRLGDLRLTIDTSGSTGLFPDQEVAP